MEAAEPPPRGPLEQPFANTCAYEDPRHRSRGSRQEDRLLCDRVALRTCIRRAARARLRHRGDLAAMQAADWIGIDAPFGWPEAMVETIYSYAKNGIWPKEAVAEQLRYRSTDWFVHELITEERDVSVWPLSVSSDRIVGSRQRHRAGLYPALRLLAQPHRGAVQSLLLHPGRHRPRHPGPPDPPLHRLAQPQRRGLEATGARRHGKRCLTDHWLIWDERPVIAR